MELFELKYFLAVARSENVNRAAETIHVSAGSLSKAISRIEDELGVPLFFKSGRAIRLTPEGQLLKKRAAEIVALEEDVKLELQGLENGAINVFISSEEILQSSLGIKIAHKVNSFIPNSRIQFLIRSEATALSQVQNGEAHIALITQSPPATLVSKVLTEVKFRVCASPDHPLLKGLKRKRKYSVKEIQEHPFVVPDSSILGRITGSESIDGWRDDVFPRIVKYKVCGVKMMEDLIKNGLALAYAPDYFIESAGLVALDVKDCHYTCEQKVSVVSKDPTALSWLSKLWDLI